MTFERTKNSTRTMLFGVLNRIITILFPFVTRTIIIYKLGTEYAGLSSLFTSILSILSISELGIGTAIVFCLYEPVAKDDKTAVRALLGLLRKLYWIIGAVILVVGFALMPFLKFLIGADYPPDLNLYLLFAIYLLNSSVSYLSSAYKGVIFNVYQRGDITHNINSVAEIFKYAIQIVALLLWADYYIFVLIMLLSTLLVNLLNEVISRKKFPELYPQGKVDAETQKIIKNKVLFLSAHSITSKLINSADNIIISTLIGLTAVGIYGNYNYISTALIGMLLIVYGSVRASVGNSMYSETRETNLKTFNALWLGSAWVSSWCAIAMLCLYQPFMRLWVGEENLLPFSAVLFIVLYFQANACNQFFTSTYISVAGLWNKTLLRQIIAVVVNVVLNIVLGIHFGITGIVFASFITTILIVYPFDIYITYKHILGVGVKEGFLKATISYLWFVALGALCYCACELLPFDGVPNFLLRLVICLILPNGIYLLAVKNKPEIKYLSDHAKGIVKRK